MARPFNLSRKSKRMPLITKMVVSQQEHVVGFVCDRCKAEHDDTFEMQERFDLRVCGGYASVWGDESRWSGVLCQRCAFDLLSPFMKLEDVTEHVELSGGVLEGDDAAMPDAMATDADGRGIY